MNKKEWEELKQRRKKLHKFYNSKVWREVREYVLMRDHYLCQDCGRPAEHVHHIEHLTEVNVDDASVSLNAENLVSLCKLCHDKRHSGEHAMGRAKKERDESWEYEFDENGMLVQKK